MKKITLVIMLLVGFSSVPALARVGELRVDNSKDAISLQALSPVTQTPANSIAQNRQLETTLTSLAPTYNLYSPTEIKRAGEARRIWMGGWATEKDPENYLSQMQAGADPSSVPGPDKIYTGTIKDNGDVSDLKDLSFSLNGYHVNDATVLQPPSSQGIDRSKWLYMYFTMLDNSLAERCRKDGKNILDCPYIFEGHDIGFASSVDGGLSWTFRGIIIEAKKSGDEKGAWMPSAVVRENDIALYYSTGRQNFNQENIFRILVDFDGNKKLSDPEKVNLQGFVPGDLLANIDAMKFEDRRGNEKIILVGNSGDQHRIPAYESIDGLTFTLLSRNLLGRLNSANPVITPHLETMETYNGGYRFSLLFSETSAGNSELRRAEILLPNGIMDLNPEPVKPAPPAPVPLPAPVPSPAPIPAPAPAPVESNEMKKFKAGKAFTEAFARLEQLKNTDPRDEILAHKLVQDCRETQKIARVFGVAVDKWECSLPLEEAQIPSSQEEGAETKKYKAGQEFTEAFDRLTKYKQRNPNFLRMSAFQLVEDCIDTQAKARALGVPVDQWVCNTDP